MHDLGHMVEAHTGTTGFDAILSECRAVVGVSRCGLARGTSLCERVLALILRMMTGSSLKAVSSWAVLTMGIRARFHGVN